MREFEIQLWNFIQPIQAVGQYRSNQSFGNNRPFVSLITPGVRATEAEKVLDVEKPHEVLEIDFFPCEV